MTLYDVLEVSPYASKEVITKAYRILTKKYNPDLQIQNLKNDAEDKLKEINFAYEILSDDFKREEYNSQIGFNGQNNVETDAEANKPYEKNNDIINNDAESSNDAVSKVYFYVPVFIIIIIGFIWIGSNMSEHYHYYKNSQTKPVPTQPIDKYTQIVQEADNFRTYKSYQDALNKYAEAINLDGNRANAFIGRSGAYYDLGLYGNGIEDATKAIKLEPNNPDGYFQRAYGYLILKRYNESITDYNKGINLNPSHKLAFYNLSLNYFQISDYKNALVYINKAIKVNPDDFNGYLLRAQIYEKLEEYRMATKEYRRVLSMYPNHPEATQGLQRTYDKDLWSR